MSDNSTLTEIAEDIAAQYSSSSVFFLAYMALFAEV